MAADGNAPVNGNANTDTTALAEDIKQSRQFQMDMLKLQTQVQTNAQEVSTRANIEKAKHDAMMNIANNMK